MLCSCTVLTVGILSYGSVCGIGFVLAGGGANCQLKYSVKFIFSGRRGGFFETLKVVFEKLECGDIPSLQFVVPAYYIVREKCVAVGTDSGVVSFLKSSMRKKLDEVYWPSIESYHFFLLPSFAIVSERGLVAASVFFYM